MIPFDNTYARLPEHFYARQPLRGVPAPSIVRLNERLISALGTLDGADLRSHEGAAALAGAALAPGAEPLAMAYAGHQFGHFNPQLGDGRAVLLGEFLASDGTRYDVHLKGSGATVFSRGGDGRSALGPVIREYVVSEFMAGLGIPTTGALAIVRTGDTVLRQQGPEPGGVLVRVAKSHVRIGTFQYFSARQDHAALRTLMDYVIKRHYPTLEDHPRPALGLFEAVCQRQAELIAHWQLVGFIHGVMNTDNVSIAGETIDFGPCAFLDAYAANKVFSSIDHRGRYAYSNQPVIGAWNLGRLADTLLPLIDDDEKRAIGAVEEVLDGYVRELGARLVAGWRAKLGLVLERAEDQALISDLLEAMEQGRADFTRTLRALSALPGDAVDGKDDALRAEFVSAKAIDSWLLDWRVRLRAEPQGDDLRQVAMKRVNPAFIPRNHQVEYAIRAAYDDQDYSRLDELLQVARDPFTWRDAHAHLALAPSPSEEVRQTFCGT
ncbi:MAG: YdiU family protein [Pseudomonadota bacterium]